MPESWLDIDDATGTSPRTRLLQSGHSAALVILTALGEYESASGADEPPIHTAAREGRVRDVKDLIDQGADVNEQHEHGFYPLHWAAVNGNLDLAKLLVNRGADTNAFDVRLTGLSAYGMARAMGYDQITDLLSRFGATQY
ncbi:MAG: ankyrin repeat domain-containing protein [Candidatus Hydrogenedentota bacterium]